MAYSITSQDRPLGVLIVDIHMNNLFKTVDMMDKSLNIQLAGLNYKPNGDQSLIDPIDRAIGAHFCTPPGSVHHTVLFIDNLIDPLIFK